MYYIYSLTFEKLSNEFLNVFQDITKKNSINNVLSPFFGTKTDVVASKDPTLLNNLQQNYLIRLNKYLRFVS